MDLRQFTCDKISSRLGQLCKRGHPRGESGVKTVNVIPPPPARPPSRLSFQTRSFFTSHSRALGGIAFRRRFLERTDGQRKGGPHTDDGKGITFNRLADGEKGGQEAAAAAVAIIVTVTKEGKLEGRVTDRPRDRHCRASAAAARRAVSIAVSCHLTQR